MMIIIKIYNMNKNNKNIIIIIIIRGAGGLTYPFVCLPEFAIESKKGSE